MTVKQPKQIILAAHFPGVNNDTIWSDPAAGSQIAFESFARFAQIAERGKFDLIFLAEGLRIQEQRGRIHELDVVGRPNTLAVLSALASVTKHIGLVGTMNSTFNEPYNLAREIATLDRLSNGRCGWNIVTTGAHFEGENFRRGGYLPPRERYKRAEEFLSVARTLWNAAETSDPQFTHVGPQFAISGTFSGPKCPQGNAVIFQAGESSEGREFAARTADAIFTRHGKLADAQAYYADVKGRLTRYGRSHDDVKMLPGVGYTLGDTEEEAEFNNAEIRRKQISPQTAIVLLEQVWNRDLSGYDPDGPLPDIDPDVDSENHARGRTPQYANMMATARKWRDIAERENLSIRELIIRVTGKRRFVGTPAKIAQEMIDFVEAKGADGFIMFPHVSPSGLEPFVERVVPLLQERGALRADYTESTLRGHLGLPPRQPLPPSEWPIILVHRQEALARAG